MTSSEGPRFAAERVAGYRAVWPVEHRPEAPEEAVRRLVDPAHARETLHWGRNYLYTVDHRMRSGAVEAVVKQFRNQDVRVRWRRQVSGSKAEKSWKMAWRLLDAGFSTAEPLAWIESERPDGPSYFVTRRVEHDYEARYLCRALTAGTEAVDFPGVDADLFLDALGSMARRLHDAGFWYRDLSAGNVLVRETGVGSPPQLSLVDLNRVRADRRLGWIRRSRDLCRLPIVRPEHQERLLRAYWFGRESAFAVKRLLYRVAQGTFLGRNRLKEAARRPFRTLGSVLFARKAYSHIPAAPGDAGARDKAVWDHLSDQPHQHATRGERLRVRIADAPIHLEAFAAAAVAAPRAWLRYRRLRSERGVVPVRLDGIGLAVRPWARDPEGALAALEELRVPRLLVRLHPWEPEGLAAEEELAAELVRRGFEVAFAVPQTRELVRDPGAWRAAVERIAERFLPHGRSFLVGQAINRSKWGVWNYREFLDLAEIAVDGLRRGDDGVEVFGPGVIDFEFQALAAVLNMKATGLRFDGVSSLLYVDRRGAPESRQLGFDTEDKVTLLRALAETCRNAGPRCWISEFNWPLWEGPHSPAGRDVSVGEEEQADYLVRYYLAALGTGHAERAYWWQLVARGYGLVDPQDDGLLRRRPAHRALATLSRTLGEGWLGAPLPSAPGTILRPAISPTGEPMVVGWSLEGERTARLPRRALRAVGRDGEELPGEGPEVSLRPAPRYFFLEAGEDLLRRSG